jgi:hypothetical protein
MANHPSKMPMFEIGDTVRIAHGLENSEGASNPEYFPNCKDHSIGVMAEILKIVASNGKSIQASYNRNLNHNLKLWVEIQDHRINRLPRRFWVKAVDVVNYELLTWSIETQGIYDATKDEDLPWKNLISQIDIFDDDDLEDNLCLIENASSKQIERETIALETKARKLYKKQFYHVVEAKRIRRWKYHVDFVERECHA